MYEDARAYKTLKSSIKLSVFKCILNASFTSQSMYPDVPSHIEVPLIWCYVLPLPTIQVDPDVFLVFFASGLNSPSALSNTHSDSNKRPGPEDLTCPRQTSAPVWFCFLKCELFW